MLLMLNETFSKLSTALTETKTTDSKSEWPKFSGDSKRFRTWYLAIMTQLSIHPWSALYDPGTNSIVSNTTDTLLNSKLYAKLISSLEGPALQNMVARKHIRANGLLLIRELQQMYKPTGSNRCQDWGVLVKYKEVVP
jgi:F0F1-type ATP synthase gamma subunit